MNRQALISLSFYIALVVFFVVYLFSIDYEKLANLSFHWGYFAAAILFSIAFRYWGAYVWIVILRSLGADRARFSPQLILVYAKSWLGRYIPGTLPWILGKIHFAAQQGIPKNKLAVSSLLEGGIQIVVTMILGCAFLLFDQNTNHVSTWMQLLMVGVVIGGIIAMIPAVFNSFFSASYKLIKKREFPKDDFATKQTIIRGALLHLVAALLNGVSFFFVAKAIHIELPFETIFYIIGAASLAGAAGMLAIFAPSGIGVREGILIVLLNVIMPTEIAVIITVATRLIGVLIDVLFFVVSYIYTKVPLASLQQNQRNTQ